MKYFKFVIILFFFIIISGCKQEYNLTVKNDSIIEKLHIEIDNNKENYDILKIKRYPIHAVNDVIYEQSVKENGSTLIGEYKYIYKPADFMNANYINQCFDNRNIIVSDNYYDINLDKYNNCMGNNSFNINIVTSNKVISNNADSKKGHKYTWHMTNENKANFSINIKIERNIGNKNNSLPAYLLYVVVGVVGIVVLLSIYIISKKIMKSDEF